MTPAAILQGIMLRFLIVTTAICKMKMGAIIYVSFHQGNLILANDFKR